MCPDKILASVGEPETAIDDDAALAAERRPATGRGSRQLHVVDADEAHGAVTPCRRDDDYALLAGFLNDRIERCVEGAGLITDRRPPCRRYARDDRDLFLGVCADVSVQDCLPRCFAAMTLLHKVNVLGT